jgi:signal peptidase I
VSQPAESSLRLARDYGGAIVIAVAVALVIRFFLFEAYRIPSSAMRPALEPGDTIFVAKWPFGLRFPWSEEALTSPRKPEYGEVVVFSPPADPRRDYVKRVIGLPGDTIALREGKLWLGDKAAVDPASVKANCGNEKLPSGFDYPVCWEPPLGEDFGPITVPPDSVFVLGDLRSQANDSRKSKGWGVVPITSLKGSAWWIWLSIEPRGQSAPSSWFSRIRFERMFQRVN